VEGFRVTRSKGQQPGIGGFGGGCYAGFLAQACQASSVFGVIYSGDLARESCGKRSVVPELGLSAKIDFEESAAPAGRR
jgi:hypothetical protein